MCGQTHPRVRQSAGVWLLALVKHCQHLQPLKDKLADIQTAFMELLASGNGMANGRTVSRLTGGCWQCYVMAAICCWLLQLLMWILVHPCLPEHP